MDSSPSFSSSSRFRSFLGDNEILYDMDEKATMFFECGYVACNIENYFKSYEMEERVG